MIVEKIHSQNPVALFASNEFKHAKVNAKYLHQAGWGLIKEKFRAAVKGVGLDLFDGIAQSTAIARIKSGRGGPSIHQKVMYTTKHFHRNSEGNVVVQNR